MQDPVSDLLLTALAHGLEEAFKLYYGIYRSQVVDNKDEEGKGRLLVHVHSIGSTKPSDQWVEPIVHAGKDRGTFWPPDIGDWVWVIFDKGNPSELLAYLPAGYGDDEVPTEFTGTDDYTPARRGVVTRLGHSAIFSDEPGEEYIRLVWHKPDEGDEALTDTSVSADRTKGKFSVFEFTKDGGLSIALNSGNMMIEYVPPKAGEKAQFMMWETTNGNMLSMTEDGTMIMDKAGNVFGLDKGKFSVIVDKGIAFTGEKASFSCGGVSLGFPAPMSAVLGEPLMAWLASHVHPTGVGPSAPPLVPPPPAILSMSVKLKA